MKLSSQTNEPAWVRVTGYPEDAADPALWTAQAALIPVTADDPPGSIEPSSWTAATVTVRKGNPGVEVQIATVADGLYDLWVAVSAGTSRPVRFAGRVTIT